MSDEERQLLVRPEQHLVVSNEPQPLPDNATTTAAAVSTDENHDALVQSSLSSTFSSSSATPEQTMLNLLNKFHRFFEVVTWSSWLLAFYTILFLGWFVITAENEYNEGKDHDTTIQNTTSDVTKTFSNSSYAILESTTTTTRHPEHTSAIIEYARTSQSLLLLFPSYLTIRRQLQIWRASGSYPTIIRATTLKWYDGIIHMLALVYVGVGIGLWHVCDKYDSSWRRSATPKVMRAFGWYMLVLTLFTLTILVPRACLPLIYLWWVQHIDRMEPKELAQGLAALMRRHWMDASIVELHEKYKNILARWQHLLRAVIIRLQASRLVGQWTEVRLLEQSADYGTRVVRAKDSTLTCSTTIATTRSHDDATMECCICLSPFDVINVKTAGRDDTRSNQQSEGDAMVQTVGCGHLFHHDCLEQWILTNARSPNSSSHSWPISQQEPHPLVPCTTCPLCRSELVVPPNNSPV
jgi:Zinc finger, C3HC4 type (RING finger)